MAKLALLIGVSEYAHGFDSLPGAAKDVEAMRRVLLHPEMGGFDSVQPLINPDLGAMQEAIDELFYDRQRDDLVLLFFSGHGVKDASGKLYFTNCRTRKTPQGELAISTAVPAQFIHKVMGNCRSRRQVIILDCCFSGAFADNWMSKDDGSVDVRAELGGEGRVVLTSSTSTQYSFGQKDSDLSIYTRYLVEGIETGAADLNSNGIISAEELHDYASRKVQETSPTMKPGILIDKEGYKIFLAKTQVRDPQLRYQKAVEHVASEGVIFPPDRPHLDELRDQLGLSQSDADDIEVKVLQAYRRYQERLEHYRKIFRDIVGKEYPIGERARNRLKDYQDRWEIKPEDTLKIESEIIQQNQELKIAGSIPNPVSSDGSETPGEAIEPKLEKKWLVVAIMLVFGVPIVSLLGMGFFINSARRIIFSEPPQPPRQEIPFPVNEPRGSSTTPTPTPTPTSEAEPIKVENCIIKVTHPLGDDFPGGEKSPVVLHEEPRENSAQTTNVNFGEHKVLYLQRLNLFSGDQKWYQINHDGRLGWIEIGSINLSFLEIPSSCP
jgi:hypothetical protein